VSILHEGLGRLVEDLDDAWGTWCGRGEFVLGRGVLDIGLGGWPRFEKLFDTVAHGDFRERGIEDRNLNLWNDQAAAERLRPSWGVAGRRKAVLTSGEGVAYGFGDFFCGGFGFWACRGIDFDGTALGRPVAAGDELCCARKAETQILRAPW